MNNDVTPGKSYPLGAFACSGGTNFSVYSKDCDRLELLLFDDVDAAKPSRTIRLDRDRGHRTFRYWHAYVPGITAGQIYAYRVYGPYAPQQGLRFDSKKVLLDPYGRALAIPAKYDREAAAGDADNVAVAMKSVVVDNHDYDWQDDRPLQHRFAKSVIYEMHVGGFTRNPNSGLPGKRRGTYAGLIDKLPYLQSLGVTAIELLPVFQFDEQEAMGGLANYWGYNPVSFFTPHAGYSSDSTPLGVLNEFRDMVKACHRADIEVILDVVYNHTAEGNRNGPTFCFKGFANDVYYILSKDKARYENYSGTGNTLNANHSIVRRLILDSLRYWVHDMHVDGFRFDLASVLTRDIHGRPLPNPPILWDIETDPVLIGTKLIAEAWDAAGLYEVGTFFGDRWKEWNGKFRDDVRSFVKGDAGYTGKMAYRFLASPDLYGHEQREPEQSINFVTCHDGFTMNDLVSYNEKHNLANNEQNRDGHNDNRSWNCGIEGPTDDPEIEALRLRQIKNFFTINSLALGVPMILMGDEVRRTQQGNNNAYCQNNELSWFDWDLVEKHAGLLKFVKELIQFRLSLPGTKHGQTLMDLLKETPIQWHGVKLQEPDWSPQSRSLSFTIHGRHNRFHLIANAYWEPLTFELPTLVPQVEQAWCRVIDTSLASPDDFRRPNVAPAVSGVEYSVQTRSIVLLIASRNEAVRPRR